MKKAKDRKKKKKKPLNNAHKGLTETKVQGMMHQIWQLSSCGYFLSKPCRGVRETCESGHLDVSQLVIAWSLLNTRTTCLRILNLGLRSLWLKCLWWNDVAVTLFEKGFTNCLATSVITSSLCHIDFFELHTATEPELRKPAVDHPDWR